MAAGTLYMFSLHYENDLALAQTVAFTTLVMFEIFAVIGSRSLSPLRKLNPLTNLWLLGAIITSVVLQVVVVYWAPMQQIFGTKPIPLNEWWTILAVSSAGLFVMEASKFFIKFKSYASFGQKS